MLKRKLVENWPQKQNKKEVKNQGSPIWDPDVPVLGFSCPKLGFNVVTPNSGPKNQCCKGNWPKIGRKSKRREKKLKNQGSPIGDPDLPVLGFSCPNLRFNFVTPNSGPKNQC